MRIIIVFSIIFLLFGCKVKSKMEFENGWCNSQEYLKSYTSIKGSEKADLCLRLAVDEKYKYKNFVFVLQITTPDKLYTIDTLSFTLDSTMRSTVRSEFINDKVIISDMFLTQGAYHFRVKQIMCDTLWGVRKCTLRVIPKQDNE